MNEADRAAFYDAEEELMDLEFDGDYEVLELKWLENPEEGANYLSSHSPLAPKQAKKLLHRVYG